MRPLFKLLYWPFIWITVYLAALALSRIYPVEDTPYTTLLRVVGIIMLGYSIVVTSIGGRTLKLYGHTYAGKNFWPDKLVTEGIYSCMRHPQHVGLAIFPLSIALLTGNLWFIALSGWAVLASPIFVLLVEEPECLEKYGDGYVAYMLSVPAFSLNVKCLLKGLKYLADSRKVSPNR